MLNEERKLPDKEWRVVIDTYLYTKTMHADDFDQMSVQQKIIINEIKKSFNRNKKTVWKE